MIQEPNINLHVRSKRGGQMRKNVPHYYFRCIRGDLYKTGGDIFWGRVSGFINPHKHLRTCLSNGDDEHLLKLFCTHREVK